MKRENIIILSIMVVVLLIAAAFTIYYINKTGYENNRIDNFEECAAAGYPVMESYPRQCRTPNGRTFVEQIQKNQTPSIDSYFIEQFREKAVENNGGAMPIEGFDPDLYMGAYPGLVPTLALFLQISIMPKQSAAVGFCRITVSSLTEMNQEQ